MGLCQPARCGCAIQSSTLTVTGNGNAGSPYVINGITPYLALEAALPGAGTRFVGMHVFATDTLRTWLWTGTAWEIVDEPRQAYAGVTATQSVNLLPTAATAASWFKRSRGTWRAQLQLSFGAAGTGGSAISISTPLTITANSQISGQGWYFDAGSRVYAVTVATATVTTFSLYTGDTGALFGADPPVAVNTTDALVLNLEGRY